MLTADELLAGSALTFEVEVPAELEARALWIFRAVSVRAAPPS